VVEQRIDHYQVHKIDTCEAIDGLDALGKLGQLIKILKEYVDCFAWNYNEIPGLSCDLVEHRLPIKPGCKPYKQPRRNFNPDIYDRMKEEINRLPDAKFIKPCRYADWISNIVPVGKKEQRNFEFVLILEISIKRLLKMNILCLYPTFLLILHIDIEYLAFLMVMLVTIKSLWPKRISPKRL
jgi:hypothetical protein